MKNSNNRSLLEETRREAAEIEAELARHPELDDFEVTEEMDAALFEKIREYEESVEHSTEENVPSDAEETEKTIPYRKKKKRKKVYIALVAVLVLIIGLGVSSVGSKSYLKQVWEQDAGNEDIQMVQVEDMDAKGTTDGEELRVYKEIYEKIGINVPRVQYKLKDMKLTDYEIDEDLQSAMLFYKDQGNVLRYYIYLNDQDSSMGMKAEDKISDSYTITKNNGVDIFVEEYDKEDSVEPRMVASFDYEGVHYQLKGVMNQKKFEEVLKNLYFLK